MKAKLLCVLIATWFVAFPAHPAARTVADNLEGDWVGGSNLFGSPALLSFNFVGSSAGLQGTANIQSWRVSNRALTKVQLEGSRLHLELPSTTGIPFVADGEIKGGVIEGTIRRGETEGKFHLVRVANVDRKLFDRYVGEFRFNDPKTPGKSESSLITYNSSGYLRWVNLKTGDTTGLFPLSDTRFFFAGAVVASPTPSATWTFERSSTGAITRSIVQVAGQPDNIGLPVPTYHQELVSIKNGAATLSGTLVLPSGKGKHPVTVFVPGSGALSRDASAPFREFDTFIKNGVGLLIYDKRGTGMSSGDWQKESFDELATDALAAVALLKKRKDLDSRKIGVWGFSQGGTIAPLAASRSKDIAFVIIASGGGVGPQQAEINEQVARMRAQKLSAAEIDEAIAFMNLQFDVVRHPERWEEFQAAAARNKEKKWYRYTWGGLPKDNWLWNWWRPIVNYDPIPVLSRVKVPVLVLFGAADQFTPSETVPKFIETMSAALARGGNRDVTSRIFPDADHDLNVKLENGQFSAPPDYHEVISNWLKRAMRSRRYAR